VSSGYIAFVSIMLIGYRTKLCFVSFQIYLISFKDANAFSLIVFFCRLYTVCLFFHQAAWVEVRGVSM